MQTFRKISILVLFLWFIISIMMTLFGTDLFFPFDYNIDESEQLYRYKTSRFAAGCLLAYAVFRYLFSYKASPSLAIVLNFGVFYLIGGLFFGFRDEIDLIDMKHLLLVAFLVVLIWFELRQRTKEDAGRFRRDHF
ncbi:MAG: hypothetical protein CMM26_06730 [Rhodospirillaceae bacterium]|nr:hypothetical protein [Rhodospirillaceae bacterium]